jgi:hypothetical protein
VSDPFATATELAQYMGLSEPVDLARYQAHLGYASAAVRRFCGQSLSQVAADVVTLEPVDRDTLLLPERPVTAITTVVANGVTLSPSTDYRFTRAGRLISGTLLAFGSDWTYGATVTYDHGYAETTDEFAAIKTVCLQIASRSLQRDERAVGEFNNTFSITETAGYAPESFLTPGEKLQLWDLGKVLVG